MERYLTGKKIVAQKRDATIFDMTTIGNFQCLALVELNFHNCVFTIQTTILNNYNYKIVPYVERGAQNVEC